MPMTVPFLDLKAQYNSIKDEISVAIQEVIDRTAFAGGPFVEQFENQFARYCRTDYAIGAGSGTSALWLALVGLGIGHGDEVITVPNTFIATAEAISFCNATPVFVDIDEHTYTMNPDLIEQAITPKTKAIIPVHLFGQTANMDPILEISKRHGLFVIEDACQAHGATYKGKPAGSMGDAGCFSFYPGKNLGAYGEGGAIITNNPDLAARLKIFRDHGQSKKYHHDIIGWNARLDGIQAAILSTKLRHLDDWNELRRRHARAYTEAFANIAEIITPTVAVYGTHVFHIYAIRIPNRDDIIMNSLNGAGIGFGIHYPVPLHLTKAYHHLGLAENSFPIAEKCANELLSLPMFPELTEEQIDIVVNAIRHEVGNL